jgi:hypothetical protein
MRLGSTEIAATFAEAFTLRFSRLVVTAVAVAAAFVVPPLLSRGTIARVRAMSRDHVRDMQVAAETQGRAGWGHWGDQPGRYVSWSNHSNRLIPVYTFGIGLESVSGTASVYRDADRLAALYGRAPDHTLNPDAPYFDQTDVMRLQRLAADTGKKRVVLIVFDGMDWHTTRAAAIAWVASPKTNTRLPVRYVESTDRAYHCMREWDPSRRATPGCSRARTGAGSTPARVATSPMNSRVAPSPIGTMRVKG